MILTVSKAGWDALTTKERKVMRFVLSLLQLGEPGIYVDTSDGRHFAFRDSRISLLDFAVLACFAANRADLPVAYEVPEDGEGNVDKGQLRVDIQNWLLDPARVSQFVPPGSATPADPDIGITAEDVLAANNAPGALGATIDPTWVPYDDAIHGAL